MAEVCESEGVPLCRLNNLCDRYRTGPDADCSGWGGVGGGGDGVLQLLHCGQILRGPKRLDAPRLNNAFSFSAPPRPSRGSAPGLLAPLGGAPSRCLRNRGVYGEVVFVDYPSRLVYLQHSARLARRPAQRRLGYPLFKFFIPGVHEVYNPSHTARHV